MRLMVLVESTLKQKGHEKKKRRTDGQNGTRPSTFSNG